MNVDDLQWAVNTILADMVARGLRAPVCTAFINAEADPTIYLHWDEDGCTYGRTELGRGDSIEEALQNARDIITAIPPKEERDRAEFTRLLANAIDKGRSIGIEVDFLNPLTETMKRLSENAITYQPTVDVTA
jgi:hypothetical protein